VAIDAIVGVVKAARIPAARTAPILRVAGLASSSQANATVL